MTYWVSDKQPLTDIKNWRHVRRDTVDRSFALDGRWLETHLASVILHVEHEFHGGPYRITTEQPDRDSDVLAWLWQGDPPAGTEVKLVEEQLGYNKFDVTGIHEEESKELNTKALERLSTAEPLSYEDYLAHLDQLKKKNEEYLNSPVPHLGGVTFREVWDNFDTWKGLRESDGWFVWLGDDPAHYDPATSRSTVIEMWELPTNESVRRDIHWYVDQGNSLHQAVRNVMKDQVDEMSMLILGFTAA
jgi:hypothetical protein